MVYWGISKQFLKPFELDQAEAFLLPSSELNGTSPNAILSCSLFRFFLSFYTFRRTKFRIFSVSNNNTYLDTGISSISLRFGGLEITLVRFFPLFTRFRFVYISCSCRLRLAEGAIFKILSLRVFKFSELKLEV